MRTTKLGIGALIVALCGVLTGGVSSAAAAPYCGITWGSQPKAAGQGTAATLISTRTGRHGCWDRVVFEFSGPANGYSVHYGEVSDEAEGLVMNPYIAGGAHLKVQLKASTWDGDHHITYPYRNGDHPENVLRYSTLRDVLFGGSHESLTTFGVGTRARLPFRVFTLAGPGSHSRIVVDVAHRW